MSTLIIALSCAVIAVLIYLEMRRLDSFIKGSAVTENPRRKKGEPFSESQSRVVYVDKKLGK